MAISDALQRAADVAGVRLEMVSGVPIWEAHPVLKHQKAVDRIRSAIRRGPGASSDSAECGCVHYADIEVLFPDGSQKRPDIAIFCREPDEQDSAVTLLPEAVIEIISKGYEAKDTVIGVPFYIAQGVCDVVLFDPSTNKVTHTRGAERFEHDSPVEIRLACGCVCTV